MLQLALDSVNCLNYFCHPLYHPEWKSITDLLRKWYGIPCLIFSHSRPLVAGKKGPTFIQPLFPLGHLFVSLPSRCSLCAMSDEHNEPLHRRLPLHRLLHVGHDLFLILLQIANVAVAVDVDHVDVIVYCPHQRWVKFYWWLKAHLHRRFLSRQLDAAFVALKLHQVSNMFETPAISRRQIPLKIAPGLHVQFWSCNFSVTKIASSCHDNNRLCKGCQHCYSVVKISKIFPFSDVIASSSEMYLRHSRQNFNKQ